MVEITFIILLHFVSCGKYLKYLWMMLNNVFVSRGIHNGKRVYGGYA